MNKDVSSTKSQKTTSKSPEKKSDDKKSAPADAQKTESAGQSVPDNKSASQTSISHFSSVSTDEYRSGWQNIFGEGNNKSKKKSPGIGIGLSVTEAAKVLQSDASPAQKRNQNYKRNLSYLSTLKFSIATLKMN